MSTILLDDDKHANVCLPRIDSVITADDTSDGDVLVVSHDRQLWPISEEIVVGEDGVRLCQFGPQDICDPL